LKYLKYLKYLKLKNNYELRITNYGEDKYLKCLKYLKYLKLKNNYELRIIGNEHLTPDRFFILSGINLKWL